MTWIQLLGYAIALAAIFKYNLDKLGMYRETGRYYFCLQSLGHKWLLSIIAIACIIFSLQHVGIPTGSTRYQQLDHNKDIFTVSNNASQILAEDSRHLAVCITGQLSRLEYESKITNIFAENQRRGISVDVFLAIQRHSKAYSKEEFLIPVSDANRTIDEVLRLTRASLHPWLRGTKYMDNITSLEMISIPWRAKYINHLKNKERRDMLGKHLRQFVGVSACSKLILDEEYSTGVVYDYVLRVRDNTIAVNPFVIPEKELVAFPGVYVKQCNGWGGLNDKVMLLHRRYLLVALNGWIENFLFTKIGENAGNPEQVLLAILEAENIPIYKKHVDDLPLVDGRLSNGGAVCLTPPSKDCRPANMTQDLKTCERTACSGHNCSG